MAAPTKLVAVLMPTGTVVVGTLIPHPLNPDFFLACKTENGRYLSVTPDGQWYLDPAVSAWQAFVLGTNGNFLVGRRDTIRTYVVGIVPFDGPAIP